MLLIINGEITKREIHKKIEFSDKKTLIYITMYNLL